jgi:hypothetical protein
MTGTGNHVWQEVQRRHLAEDRYGGICDCGDHAWTRLTKGFVALVSTADADIINRQSYATHFCRGKAYAAHATNVEGKKRTCLLHRELLDAAVGEETDFRNGNTFDCRRETSRSLASAR